MIHHILIVDDDSALCSALRGHLETVGYRAFVAHSLAQARQVLSTERIHAVLLDQNLPDGSGLDWIPEMKEEWPQTSLIIITGHGDIPTAVEAMRRGADHFATKPVYMKDLTVVLERCLEIGSLRRIVDLGTRHTREQLFMGEAFRKGCLREAELAARSESPVLLQGETGTGKSLLASWINRQGTRSKGAFVHINCAALKGDMLASELFGHAKGAFTGAVEKKQGLLEIADGGTLFLDEIGDMDPAVQSQLLNVLEFKTFRRMGEVKDRYSDFRLISATNKDLKSEVTRVTFRQDLFFRISVLTVSLPALRDYIQELPAVCTHVLKSLYREDLTVSAEAMKILAGYQWPGNIRELRNVLERAALLSEEKAITSAQLPFHISTSKSVEGSSTIEQEISEMETAHVREVIARCNGNLTKAAKVLGVSRTTLYRRLSHSKPDNP